MRSRLDRAVAPWLILGAASLSACAHAHVPDVDRGDAVRIGQVEVVVRYAARDAPEAAQVLRALEVAVPVAQGWGPLPRVVTITIHPTHRALESASRTHGIDWLRAWARRDTVELQAPRTWSSGGATDHDLTTLLAHELTHCVMFEAIGGERRLALGVPAWFREGMASTNAGERFPALDHDTEALMASAALQGDDGPLAYVAATAAFGALERKYGRARIRAILTRVGAGASFPDAFEDALGVSLDAFESGVEGALALAPSAP